MKSYRLPREALESSPWRPSEVAWIWSWVPSAECSCLSQGWEDRLRGRTLRFCDMVVPQDIILCLQRKNRKKRGWDRKQGGSSRQRLYGQCYHNLFISWRGVTPLGRVPGQCHEHGYINKCSHTRRRQCCPLPRQKVWTPQSGATGTISPSCVFFQNAQRLPASLEQTFQLFFLW